MYIDTHCHLDDQRFSDLDSIVRAYERAGVSKAIHMGCNTRSSQVGATFAEEYQSVYFGAGFHPSDIAHFNSAQQDKVCALLSHPKCVAVGEIGLDYHYDNIDKVAQKAGFVSQIEMAAANRLPVCIHMREATQDTLDILKQNKRLLTNGGVIHCFSGSVETAKEMLKLGMYISFGGTVTFKNALNLQEVAKYVPIDMMLTETDSPYLAPTPFRGTTNEPKNIPIICAFLANLNGLDNVELANKVMENAKRLFKKL